MLLALGIANPAQAQVQDASSTAEPIRVRVISGFAGVRQYEQHEVPFWTERVPALTGGRLLPSIISFSRAGLEPEHMLAVMRSGVVLFGSLEANAVALTEPELAATDLPLLADDLVSLRRALTIWQPRIDAILAERYGIEVLATFVRPPQVMFCNRPFVSLMDLAGRRVRVASVNQSDLIVALGAQPLVVAFDRLLAAFREERLDCAVTGALPGQGLGLHRLTTHISPVPLGWAMSFLTTHKAGWTALPPAVQAVLRRGLADFETEMWRVAEEERTLGLACALGQPPCPVAERGTLALVPETAASRAAVRQLFVSAVLPGWARRCGIACAESWNAIAGPVLGLFARW
ncbi:MAG: ABC transporter substrate-binding protein [Acetobacteraceae bacterium]|nr:MAG: ABC transporter substrate-binding protein [Acetobacteraceae bacterium]